MPLCASMGRLASPSPSASAVSWSRTDVDEDDIDAMDQAAADEAGLAETFGIEENEAADILAFFEYANTTCLDTEGQSTE